MSEEQIKGWFKYERKKEKKSGNKFTELISSNPDENCSDSVANASNSMIKQIVEKPNNTREGERKRKFSEVEDSLSSSIGTKKPNLNDEPLNNSVLLAAEKRSRFAFTPNQIKHLKAYYHETSKYVTRKEKLKMSEKLNIPGKQIVLWFQNRRQNETVKQQKNVDEVEANLDSTDVVEVSENVAAANNVENIPEILIKKEESMENLGEIENIAENSSNNHDTRQNRRQKKTPRKNTDESNVDTVFKTLRKKNSTSGQEDIFKKPAARSPFPPPSKKQKKHIALIAKESASTISDAAKEFVFTPEQVYQLETKFRVRKFINIFDIEQLNKTGNYPEEKVQEWFGKQRQIYISEEKRKLQKQLKMNFEFNKVVLDR